MLPTWHAIGFQVVTWIISSFSTRNARSFWATKKNWKFILLVVWYYFAFAFIRYSRLLAWSHSSFCLILSRGFDSLSTIFLNKFQLCGLCNSVLCMALFVAIGRLDQHSVWDCEARSTVAPRFPTSNRS